MQRDQHFGAYPGEWDWWVAQGYAEDLLPVVSAPAVISDDSKIKSQGKLPSRFNARGAVAGIGKWTGEHSSPMQIAAWKKDSRLGICVQTRRVRAIDIDVNDAEVVEAIRFLVWELTGEVLPMRFRSNSGKALLIFQCDAYLSKRTVRWVGDGRQMIEFLGNGQQFVAHGAHWTSDNEPSGARYEWEGGLPSSIPVLTKERALEVWAAIIERFGIADTATGGADRERKNAERIETSDPVAEHLQDQGLVIGAGDDKLFIECPWKEHHSGDSGVTQTTWLIAGSGGYERGHFECRHAGCQKYSDQEFLEAIGYLAFTPLDDDAGEGGEGFTDLGEDDGESKAVRERNEVRQKLITNREGRYVGSVANLAACVASSAFAGFWLRYDEAIDDVTITDKHGATRPVTDYDLINLRISFERMGFAPIGREAMRDAVDAVARKQVYDSYVERVRGLAWDGVPRVERFLIDCLGCEDNPYSRAVGLYWWTAMAGRLLEPGVQADMVPVMLGDQGLGKSQLLKLLANSLIDESYREINLADRDNDTARILRGCLIGELGELRGLRSRDAESIKAWITRQVETWVPKFREKTFAYRRRCIFVGTTNNPEFLDDPTGERRWLPFEARRVDLEAVRRDVLQLWAEAVGLFDLAGIAWAEAERLARLVHGDFKVGDAWDEAVIEWLESVPDLVATTTRQVAVQALGFDTRDLGTAVQMRIGKILQNCGFARDKGFVDGKRIRIYRRSAPLCPT